MTVFSQCFAVVVGEEGGYVNNPADPGGETKFGISKRSYPNLDIANLSIEKAQAIYLTDYWLRAGCDKLRPPMALIVFDAAVNNGPGRAWTWYQAAKQVSGDVTAQCAEFMALRTIFMSKLSTWNTFEGGWVRRLCALPFHAMQIDGAK